MLFRSHAEVQAALMAAQEALLVTPRLTAAVWAAPLKAQATTTALTIQRAHQQMLVLLM